MGAEPTWAESVSWLKGLESVPAAHAVGELLAAAEREWSSRLTLRTSMHEALLTRPRAEYPFSESLRVAWSDGVYQFTLSVDGAVRAADRCFKESALVVFDSFAVQLSGGDTPER